MQHLPSIAVLAILFALSACSGTITGTAVDGASDVAVDAVDAPLSDTADAQANDVSDGGDGRDALALPPRMNTSPGRRLVVTNGRTFVLNANQEWYGWGSRLRETFGEDPPTPVTAVTRLDLDERNYVHWFGDSTVCRVERTGLRRVQCWGSNSAGELGIGLPTQRESAPRDVPRLTHVRYMVAGARVASTDEGVFGWLVNRQTTSTEFYWPRLLRSTPVCAMSGEGAGVGVAYDCAARAVLTWLFDTSTPDLRLVETNRPIDDVAALASLPGALVAVRRDGSTWCSGACVRTPGRPEHDLHDAFEPIRGLPPLKYVVGSTTMNGACGITLQDEVVCWGYCRANPFLGSGCDPDTRTSDWMAPTRIPELSEVSELAMSNDHACALTRRHELWCWGRNYAQQAVPGSDTVSFYHPVRIDVPNL